MDDQTAHNIRTMVWTKPDIVIETALWHAFHAACLQHQTHPSREMQRLMQEQLDVWHHHHPKETDHA